MKKEISSMDLHFLTREFQALIGGKVDKIFQGEEDKKEFLFRFHVPGTGKHMLSIKLPNLIYLSEYKQDYGEHPPGYCMFLRKYLGNARVRKIEQKDFERILLIEFESKLQGKLITFCLVLELFSKGNMILCDEKMVIKSPLENQNWADRTIRGNIEYRFPPTSSNTLALSKEAFLSTLRKSDKESLVKSLAIDFSLGGVYSEETCTITGIDKDQKPSSIDEKNAEKIFNSVQEIKEKMIAAVKKQDQVLPFDFKSIQGEKKAYPSFSSAVDENFSTITEKKDSTRSDEKKKQKMLNSQEMKIQGYEQSAVENQRKAELLYEHYQEVQQALEQIHSEKKKHDWKEVKKKFKNHKIIKEINEKEGKIILEL